MALEAVIRFFGVDDTKQATDSAARNTDELGKKVVDSNKKQEDSYKKLNAEIRRFGKDLQEVSRFAIQASAASIGLFSVAIKNAEKDIPAVHEQLKSMGNSFQVLSNNVATAVLPTLQQFAQFISGLANAISGFVARNQEFVNSFLKWSAITLVVSTLGLTIAKFIKAMVSLFSLVTTGVTAMIGVFTKFSGVGLIIAALTAILVLFHKQITEFLKKIPIIGKAIESMESGFKSVTDGIDKIMKDFEEGMTATLQRTQDAFGSFSRGLKSTFNSLNDNAMTFGASVSASIETAFSDTIFKAITGRLTSLKDVLMSFKDDIARAFSKFAANELLGYIFGDKDGTKNGIGGLFSQLGKLFGFGGNKNSSPMEKLKEETDKVAKKFTGLADNMDMFGRAKDRLMDNFNRFSRQLERGNMSQLMVDTKKPVGSQLPGGIGIGDEGINAANNMAAAVGMIGTNAEETKAKIAGIGDEHMANATKFAISTAIQLATSLGALAIAVAAGIAAAAALAAAWLPAATAASIATFGGAAAAGGGAVAGSLTANQALGASLQQQSMGNVRIMSTYGVHPGATGGIVRKPTLALIGEAGPEAVVPLSGAPGASPLPSGSVGGGGININVNIDRAILNSPENMDQFVHKLSESLFYMVDKGQKRSRTANV